MESIQMSELQKVFTLIDEIAQGQQKKVEQCANRIVPHITSDDLLQPNDFPELENHPHFRYEEGLLAGIYTVQMALQAEFNATQSRRSETH